MAAAGAACTASAQAFTACISEVIINPILALFFAVGLLVFVWGVVQFIWGLGTEASHKEEGKQHMMWGIVGMFIMTAAWAILKFIANSINVSLPH
jgi:hypothetical protein